MAIFMDWLEKRLEFIDIEKYQPTEVIREEEEAIGTISDPYIQKLFGIMLQYSAEIEMFLQQKNEELNLLIISGKILPENTEDHDPVSCPGCQARREKDVMDLRYMTLSTLFWTCVKEEFKEQLQTEQYWSDPQIAIREGWQVVIKYFDCMSILDLDMEFITDSPFL